MRTIKFRGRRVDNNEWVYGYLYKLQLPIEEACLILTQDNNHLDVSLAPKYDLAFKLGVDLFIVDPETVGQFTSLYDKNGKEIYEGDIIKIPTKHGDDVFWIGYETSHIGAFCLCECDDCNSRFVSIFWRNYDYEPFDCEVIGNIHDNPNMIEL